MKKVENMPVASRPRIALDPVRVRSFRIRSGMIGLASLDSRTTKETNRTTAAPRMPSVCAETQPSLDAVTMP